MNITLLEILEIIVKYNGFFTAIFGVSIYKAIMKNVEEKKKQHIFLKNEYSLIKESLKFIHHNIIMDTCLTLLDKGVATTDEIEDLKKHFEIYQKLDGNGTGEKIYYKVIEKVKIERG